jgi:hypothetical protein
MQNLSFNPPAIGSGTVSAETSLAAKLAAGLLLDLCRLSNGVNPAAVCEKLIALLEGYDLRTIAAVAKAYPTTSGWLDLPEIKKLCEATATKFAIDDERAFRRKEQLERRAREDQLAIPDYTPRPGARRYTYQEAEIWAQYGAPWPPIGRFEDPDKRKRQAAATEPQPIDTMPEASDALVSALHQG